MIDLFYFTNSLHLKASKAPEQFLVLPKAGTLQQDELRFLYSFTDEEIKEIVDRSGYASRKTVPIDYEHALATAADIAGDDESVLTDTLPRENPAAGFVTLSATPQGIMANVVSWTASAVKYLKDGAYQYFSPTIRGMMNGVPRISSIALTNEPALDQISAFTLSALPPIQKRKDSMTLEQLQTIATAQGIESSDNEAELLSKVVGHATAMAATKTNNEALALQLKATQAANEAQERASIVAAMPIAMHEWASAQDMICLRAYAAASANIKPVPPTAASIVNPANVPPVGDDKEVTQQVKDIDAGFDARRPADTE